MVMMALLPPGRLLGGYGADADGVNGSWEKTCTYVSISIRVRVALATGELARHLPQRLFLATQANTQRYSWNNQRCLIKVKSS